MGLGDGEGNGNGGRAVEGARGPSSELPHNWSRITFENVSASWPCQKARENGQSVGILLLGIIDADSTISSINLLDFSISSQ